MNGSEVEIVVSNAGLWTAHLRSQDGRLLIGVQDVAINGAQLLGLDHGAASELFRNQKTDLSHGLLMARY